MADSQLFDDHFTVTSLNQQKYDRVTRIAATSLDSHTTLTLDINHELYPVTTGETLKIVLANTLNLDGTKDEKGWRGQQRGESTLADMYDYVCHGKVYRFEEGEKDDLRVYISFGGLLMYIEGSFKKLTPLRVDYVYLLIKK